MTVRKVNFYFSDVAMALPIFLLHPHGDLSILFPSFHNCSVKPIFFSICNGSQFRLFLRKIALIYQDLSCLGLRSPTLSSLSSLSALNDLQEDRQRNSKSYARTWTEDSDSLVFVCVFAIDGSSVVISTQPRQKKLRDTTLLRLQLLFLSTLSRISSAKKCAGRLSVL